MTQQLLNPQHRLFDVLAPPDRRTAHTITRAMQVPGNPVGLLRLLERTRGALDLVFVSADTPACATLREARDLLARWVVQGSDAEPDIRVHYQNPVERDGRAANPAHGLMTSHPVYAALMSPPMPPREEALYARIMGTIVSIRLGTDGTAEIQDKALRLAAVARQRAESHWRSFQSLATVLVLDDVPIRHGKAYAIATVWLRTARALGDAAVDEDGRELLRLWQGAMEALGSIGTGKGLATDPPSLPPEIQIVRNALDTESEPTSDIFGIGLSQADTDEVEATPLVIGADNAPDQTPPGERDAEWEAKRLWTATTRANTLLPLSWNCLNSQELQILEETLTAVGGHAGVMIIRSGLACGLRPDAIARRLDQVAVATVEQFSVRPIAGGHLVERTLSARTLPRAFAPEADSDYLKSTGMVQLRGPAIPALAGEGKTYSDALEDVLARCRQDPRIRLTHGRIARTLLADYLARSPDPHLSDLVYSAPSVQVLSGAGYYTARPASDVAASLRHPFRRPAGWITARGELMGSRGVPSREKYIQSVTALRAAVDFARSGVETKEGLCRFHNLLVVWQLVLHMTGSSHRMVSDPFPHEDCLVQDDHLFVVADKVSTPSHASRLSVAATQSEIQWRLHRAHLRELAHRLTYLESPDADRVHGLVERATPATAPFLFFLTSDLAVESISPASFRRVTNDLWPWSDSAHRHFLAYALRKHGCAPDLIHAHLGHWLRGEAPFSPQSFLRPSQMVAHLRSAIELILDDIGLKPIEGLPVAGAYRKHAKPMFDLAPWSALGPVRRTRGRKAPAVSGSHAAQEALAVACWQRSIDLESRKPSIVPRDIVVEVRHRLIVQFQDDIDYLLSSLRALRRRCMGLRKSGWSIWVPGAAFSPTDSGPVVADFSGRSIRAARQVRTAFIAWLTRSNSFLEGSDLLAATLLAAVILGGLLARKSWHRFLIAISQGAWRVSSLDWIELGEDGRPGMRFIGDAVTRGLMRRASSAKGDTDLSPQKLEVRANSLLRSICREIKRPDPALGVHGADARIETLAQILPCLSDSFACQVSGIALSYMKGTSCSRTTPPAHFARVLSGKPLAVAAEDSVESPDEPAIPTPIVLTDPTRQKQQIDRLLAILMRAQSTSVTEHDPPDQRRRKKARLNDLQEDLQVFLGELNVIGCSPSLFRQVQFALHLTQEGGIQLSELSPSTIRGYTGVGVADLTRAFGNHDPVDVDEDARARVYLTAIAQAEDESGSRVKHLRYFDLFLCEYFDIEPVPWQDIDASIPDGHAIDADYPTSHDLRRLRSISATLHHGRTLDRASALSLDFMTSTGIRSGEVYRLTLDDLLLAADPVVIVRNKASGETKTKSGVRQAAVLELPTWEPTSMTHDVTDWLGDRSTNPASPLFTASNDSTGIARSALCRRMKQALVAASGNPSARPHHLRHGLCSNVALLAADLSHPLVLSCLGKIDTRQYALLSESVRLRLTGRPHATMLWPLAIATTMGHRDFQTSEMHYVHTLDVIAAAEVDRVLPEIPFELAATLLDIKANTLYQARDRARRQEADASYCGLLLSRRIGDASPIGDSLPRFARSPRALAVFHSTTSVSDLSLWELAEIVGWVNAGTTEQELSERYSLKADESARVVTAIHDMQMYFPGRLEPTRRGEPRSGATMRFMVSRACQVLLPKDGGAGFWTDPHKVDDAGRLLACWHPTLRVFDCPNPVAEATVDRWLSLGGLAGSKENLGAKTRIRCDKPSTAHGLRLSYLLLVAYFCELRRRAQQRMTS